MRLLRRGVEIITGRDYSVLMWSRRRLGSAVLLAFVVSPNANALAGAQKREIPVLEESRYLWATVNVCDTESSPDTIGIRASMPGLQDERETMWMRFVVQYLAGDRWLSVTDGGDSGFVSVGSAGHKARQGGRSFRINPNNGKPVVLRGRVAFEWRLRGEVVRRASARTRKGHDSSAGADPRGYSAATCTVTP